MTKEVGGDFNAKGRAPISTTLANAARDAARAARVEEATRWGTRVLWAGGVLVGAFAWRFGQSAAIVGRNVVFVGAAALCVGLIFAFKKREKGKERRDWAASAARRLERRFPEQTGVLVAAVDFCEEANDSAERSTTSAALRKATVDAAIRGCAEIAAKLDAAELRAALTDLPVERFQRIGKKRRLCALGILFNGAIWGSAAIGEKWRVITEPPTVVAEVGNRPKGTPNASERKDGGDEENEGNKKGGEEKKVASFEELKGNKEKEEEKENKEGKEGITGEVGAVEEINVAALETWIAELAQNAEIAETLKAELKAAVETVDGETDAKETTAVAFDATQLLQLARELETNLARPETGLVAQTRRLSEKARRERRKLELRWTTRNESEEKEKASESANEGNVGVSKRSGRKIAGKEVGVLLLAARTATFAGNFDDPNALGDAASLGLSRVLRSESTAQRKEILAKTTERVEEWGTTLRREETAARILLESWRYDAESQHWATLVERASKTNRAALARFAGRASFDVDAGRGGTGENDGALEEAKRRFDAIWDEAQLVERECFESFERLRDRLQKDDAQEFVEFVKRVGVGEGEETLRLTSGDRSRNDVADEATDAAINDATSRAKARNAEIARLVENNRFGRVAELLERDGVAVPVPVGKGETLENKGVEKNETNAPKNDVNAENKEFKELVEKEKTEVRRNERSNERRRFSALAALLIWGSGEEKTMKRLAQVVEKDVFALRLGGEEDTFGGVGAARETSALSNASGGENGGNAANERDERTGTELDAASSNGLRAEEEKTSLEREKTSGVNIGEIGSWGAATDGGEESEPQNGKDAPGAAGSEEGTNAIGVSGVGGGAKEERDASKTTENKTFNAELPTEARQRFEGTKAPEIAPEYEEKIRLYRRRILEERR